MKAIEQYFPVVLFVFDIFKNEIQDIFPNFELSTLESERVTCKAGSIKNFKRLII